jgi:hypothetical protein
MTYTHFLLAFVALSALDARSTIAILKRGGRELNPVMRWMMGKMGVVSALMVVKGFGLAVLSAYPIPGEVQVILLVVYAAVVANNLRVLSNMKG